MKRRSVLLLLPLVSAAGCGSPGSAEPLPSISAVPDLGWPARSADLTSGFCFTLVRGIKPYALIERLGGDELERVEWHRVIGPGDGEAGARSRFFIAIGRVEDWSVIVEDNGSLGVTQEIVEPLSADGGEVVAYRGGGGRSGRLMVFRDGDLALDLDTSAPDRPSGSSPDEFRSDLLAAGLSGSTATAEPTAAALTFLAARTGVVLTAEQVEKMTYLLVTVPQV
ncbi:hypothetical protein Ait01nite_051470 [Actinoplanes italicus]|uniref:Lipoprotein n=1 Tax=Actinoplanes italicus TaxID=113567 RepID=A0A2T0K0N9_9ACTN|nr:DUF6461 domain-containing protein [Actinoplanes italicus]PRX16140.1 hypothetical protein CLV67_121189 [Actinoplanes italicus]GIE32102.1 hypothetical protein Ait01nite_051470 [Actinoplanes italicus]